MADSEEATLRIGELARRAGIPPATLRAWERRYGIVEPQRTEGGYRLYSEADERRLKRMLELITRGLAPAEAAQRALLAPPEPAGAAAANGDAPPTDLDALCDELLERLRAYDELGAHRAIDRALSAYGVGSLLSLLILPVLRRIGDLWSRDELSVAEEHFATHVIRGRLLSLGRGWAGAEGRLAMLACPPGEQHDLGAIVFGLMLRERGWRIAFLGADTPIDTLEQADRRLAPAIVVLSVTDPGAAQRLLESGPEDLSGALMLAGAAATAELCEAIGARRLPVDVSDAAEAITPTV